MGQPKKLRYVITEKGAFARYRKIYEKSKFKKWCDMNKNERVARKWAESGSPVLIHNSRTHGTFKLPTREAIARKLRGMSK